MMTNTHYQNGQSTNHIHQLIDELCNADGSKREKARKLLVKMGMYAAPALLGTLKHRNPHARWEAAKALKEIKEPSCIPGLIRTLSDERSDIRWLAAEALVAYSSTALPALYKALIDHRHHDTVWLHQGAHHILHAYAEKHDDVQVAAILEALDGPVSSAVAVAAFEALRVILE